MTEEEEIEALNREMERIRAVTKQQLEEARSGKEKQITLSIEDVDPENVREMALAGIPALLEKAYTKAMDDRASLDSVLKCLNLFMERALGKPKEHIELKVTTQDEAKAALLTLMADGLVNKEVASGFLAAFGAEIIDIDVNDEIEADDI